MNVNLLDPLGSNSCRDTSILLDTAVDFAGTMDSTAAAAAAAVVDVEWRTSLVLLAETDQPGMQQKYTTHSWISHNLQEINILKNKEDVALFHIGKTLLNY